MGVPEEGCAARQSEFDVLETWWRLGARCRNPARHCARDLVPPISRLQVERRRNSEVSGGRRRRKFSGATAQAGKSCPVTSAPDVGCDAGAGGFLGRNGPHRHSPAAVGAGGGRGGPGLRTRGGTAATMVADIGSANVLRKRPPERLCSSHHDRGSAAAKTQTCMRSALNAACLPSGGEPGRTWGRRPHGPQRRRRGRLPLSQEMQCGPMRTRRSQNSEKLPPTVPAKCGAAPAWAACRAAVLFDQWYKPSLLQQGVKGVPQLPSQSTSNCGLDTVLAAAPATMSLRRSCCFLQTLPAFTGPQT